MTNQNEFKTPIQLVLGVGDKKHQGLLLVFEDFLKGPEISMEQITAPAITGSIPELSVQHITVWFDGKDVDKLHFTNQESCIVWNHSYLDGKPQSFFLEATPGKILRAVKAIFIKRMVSWMQE
ncbi:MAG: hypothetical protein WCV85_02625 [Patescibacteria group bacterium]|jgi:hypothetical protein